MGMLAKKQIFFVGSILKKASGFPELLKACKPPKCSYISKAVGDINYFVFHDCKVVCFVTNVFPEQMDSKVARPG